MAKAAYIGIPTAFPVYKEETKTIAITAANVAQYFTVTNGSYYFAGSGNVFTSNNGGVNSSEATTTLTAKVDISSLAFRYSYSSEQNYDTDCWRDDCRICGFRGHDNEELFRVAESRSEYRPDVCKR